MIEDDIFKTIVHVTDQVTDQATMHDTMQATTQAEQKEKILEFCKSPKTRKEIQEHLEFKNREYFRKEILNPLLNQGSLIQTIPDKPKSPNQRYIAVNRE